MGLPGDTAERGYIRKDRLSVMYSHYPTQESCKEISKIRSQPKNMSIVLGFMQNKESCKTKKKAGDIKVSQTLK